MTFPMPPELLHILQHSLGLNQYGEGNVYRNRFVTGSGSDDFDKCQKLVSEGLMTDLGPQAIAGGMHCFVVTDKGKVETQANSPKPPKLSRSQRRYKEFIAADCGLTFRQWIGATK